jgi:hypothetical protein
VVNLRSAALLYNFSLDNNQLTAEELSLVPSPPAHDGRRNWHGVCLRDEESRERTALLTVNGSDEAQGLYFSPAFPPQQCAQLLASVMARV